MAVSEWNAVQIQEKPEILRYLTEFSTTCTLIKDFDVTRFHIA